VRWPADIAPTLNAAFGKKQGLEDQHALGGAGLFVPIAHSLRAEGFDASEDGTGRGTPLVPVAFHPTQDPISSVDGTTHAMGTGSKGGTATVAVAFEENFDAARKVDVAPEMTANGYKPSQNAGGLSLQSAMQVRRLTPRECERLQGFPDDWTAIPWRGKPPAECPDGPRYKALGNSMAVPVMRWIGERIAKVSA
jgi:DNA (cytosine-5)-methyltransferase 1